MCAAIARKGRGLQACTALQVQGPDGKWNKFTGRCAWDASWLCSNEQEQYGGTGERKPEDMVFPYAPNLDHSQVPPSPLEEVIHEWLNLPFAVLCCAGLAWPGLMPAAAACHAASKSFAILF